MARRAKLCYSLALCLFFFYGADPGTFRWTVTGHVHDFGGRIRGSTLYYCPNGVCFAQAANFEHAAELQGIPRPVSHVLPNWSGGLSPRPILFQDDPVPPNSARHHQLDRLQKIGEMFAEADAWLSGAAEATPMMAFWKPAGVVTTMSATDNGGKFRSLVIDSARKLGIDGKVPQPCGRLDKGTTGLMLCTANGDVNWLVCTGALPKTYVATVNTRTVKEEQLQQLRTGVELDGGRGSNAIARAASVEVAGVEERVRPDFAQGDADKSGLEKAVVSKYVQLRLTICEGRYHIVKRMLATVGLTVKRLHREGIGCLSCSALGLQGPGDATLVTSRQTLQMLDCCGGQLTPNTGVEIGRRGRGIYNALRCGRLLCMLRGGLERPEDEPRLEAWLREHWTLDGLCLEPLAPLGPGVVRKCACFESKR